MSTCSRSEPSTKGADSRESLWRLRFVAFQSRQVSGVRRTSDRYVLVELSGWKAHRGAKKLPGGRNACDEHRRADSSR